MTDTSVKIALTACLLFASAVFSCSETAFFSLTRAQINGLKRSRKMYARQAVKLLKNPREALITILLGNELVNVAFAIMVASLVYDLMGPIGWKSSIVVSICVATPLILVFGEVLPKNIAVRYAPKLLPFLGVVIRLFYQIVLPARFLLTKFADQMVILFGGDPTQVRSMIMEEEFRQLVDLGYREGAIEEGETELIHRLFELGNRKVKEIMTPAGRMFRLPLAYSLEKIISEMRATQFNRVPVYRGDPDNIVGALHSRDVFRLYRGRQRGHMQEVDEIVRPVIFVRENVTIENVLTEFQKKRVHIGIIMNKEEKVVGLVTMDDIFKLLFTQKLERRREAANSRFQIPNPKSLFGI